ncbi:putative carboxypeptidase A-like protein, partial [Operophtera brumata]
MDMSILIQSEWIIRGYDENNNQHSARESRALGRFVESKSEDLEYYLSFHSYGQFIIIPYAFSKTHAENYDETQEMGLRAAYKIRSFNNKSYAVGTAYDTVGYTVGGSSTCW